MCRWLAFDRGRANKTENQNPQERRQHRTAREAEVQDFIHASSVPICQCPVNAHAQPRAVC